VWAPQGALVGAKAAICPSSRGRKKEGATHPAPATQHHPRHAGRVQLA
jgi:hypothetical protein